MTTLGQKQMRELALVEDGMECMVDRVDGMDRKLDAVLQALQRSGLQVPEVPPCETVSLCL